MKIADLVAGMERIAPLELAEEWDNVGLLVGRTQGELRGDVLLTIDLTERVLEEAIARGCGAIVAYHPPIFHPIKRLVDDAGGAVGSGVGSGMTQRVVHRAIASGIAIYSPHTALDATTHGVTDWLADGVLEHAPKGAGKPGAAVEGGGDRRALRPHARREATQQLKLVTFVPAAEVENVRSALASAGAGIIGNYERCSFATLGEGTFLGTEGASPALGKAGQFETVSEIRLEMVCSRRALSLALATLRQFHPYEEAPVDVYALEARPDRAIGAGRRVTLDQPATLNQLADRLKGHLGASAISVGDAGTGGGGHGATSVGRVAVVPGAGASFVPLAIQEACDVLVTGEMKHHEVNSALASGLSVILGGHTATERGYLPTLRARIEQEIPGLKAVVSTTDRDPLVAR